MELLGLGRTAEVFLTDDGKALKLFYPEFQDRGPQQEERISRIISDRCPSAPTFFGTTTVDGRIGLLYEHIEGAAVNEASIRPDYTVEDFARQLARLHLEIHRASGVDLPSWESRVGAGIEHFEPMSRDGKAVLLSHVHRNEPFCLCHGDFHPENVILDPRRCLRPIDWVNAYRGHAFSDVARTTYLIQHGLKQGLDTISEEERPLRDRVSHVYLDEYFDHNPPEEIEWAAWQLTTMILRDQEGIDAEKAAIRKMILNLQSRYPDFK